MNQQDFEGTLVMEKMSRIDKLEEFMDAVDSADFEVATALMTEAGIDGEAMATVLKKMADPYDEH